MKSLYWIFLIVGIFHGHEWVFAADHHFSGTAPSRHQQMTRYFSSENVDHTSIWDSPYLTGDWNGSRSKLARDGVTIGGSYVADIQGNPIGGEEQGIAFAGSLGLDMKIDIGTYTRLKGLSFYTSVVARTGTSLSGEKIGNQFPVAQVYGGQNIRLNELFLKQVFNEEKILLKLGRLDAGNDFLQSELYYKFVNNGFDGNPISVFFNTPFTAYPDATWGVLFQCRPHPQLLMRYAVYVAQDDVAENKYHGFNWSFNGSDGFQLITEWAWQVNQLKTDTGYPGNYRAGYFYFTDSTGVTFSGDDYTGNKGYYFLVDQMIYRHGSLEEKRGLTPFLAVVCSPEDRNLIPFFISSGLVYKGLFPSRPNDHTNIGYVYGKYSKQMRKIEGIDEVTLMLPNMAGNRPQNFEAVLEINHWFQCNQWCTIVPDIQYIINPKGYGTTPNAWVFGVQIGVVL